MRRLVGCVLCLLCMASCALAQTDTYMDIVDAVYALGADHVTFSQDGDWLSAVLSREETLPQMGSVTQWEGVAYHLSTGEPVGWDEVFSDGDAAAARLEEIAQTALYANAYAEYSRFSPVPRDSFALENGQLTVYYPAEQFSHFSGVSGALSVYAYEMDGLLCPDIPWAVGDTAQAAQGLATALETGALPGALSEWTLGRPMAEADAALRLVDVPDIKLDYAVYHFEAAPMRGVSLLSTGESVDSALIEGVFAERMDFCGLCTGVAAREACVAALGEPDESRVVETADAYSRLPAGETLCWRNETRALELHFVDGVLHSVTLLAL
ncbi:MAG TPA: hypothetical protein IAA66_04860 [Candidatus Avichristensenella intestinipullorum]|uniref:DUF3298 domain-containing protein n=1 Tax=Candidatus Avichristensenella intestinipullorum TaxID=2840693 RepID=A0A9D0YVT6_9FIRM|nr:hypothetical protein [Candidatus Avichristensenella intestinipullorum]